MGGGVCPDQVLTVLVSDAAMFLCLVPKSALVSSQLEQERREAEMRAKREEEERKRQEELRRQQEEILRRQQEEERKRREEEELARRKQVCL